MLGLKNLTVSVAGKKILKNINLSFESGKVYALMGPNGSGKSTLASVVMGNPSYKIGPKSLRHGSGQAKIIFQNENISKLSADKRARKGIFMSFQTPLSLSGVSVYQLMRYALDGKLDPLEIRQKVKRFAKELSLSEELLSRSLNDGFSGGEKKKMEILQAAILDPTLFIFDEIDTGVDVDAMRKIAQFIKKLHQADRTFILITHYNRILKYIRPDEVIVIIDGQIAKIGDAALAVEIEKNGYERI